MPAAAAPLKAGAARVDITPEMGIQLAGDIGRYRPTEEIRERLYAHALVVEADGERLCILSLDLLSTSCDWSDALRARIAAAHDMPVSAVMLHVTQNHSSPSAGHLALSGPVTRLPDDLPWLRGGDDRYNAPTADACLRAVAEAVANLTPVTLQIGHGMDGRVAFNRRFVMRDGSSLCHPPTCSPDILHVEGPTDPEIGVATFTDAAGQVIAALLHFTCHPCHGYPTRYVIADWPGAWAARMQAHWGPACVPLVINGCCGNIHHRDHTNPKPLQDHQKMGAMLAETTLSILDRLQPAESARVRHLQTRVPLALRALTAAEASAAEALVGAHPEPIWLDDARTRVDWDWFFAVSQLDLRDCRELDPTFAYEIQAFQIGDLSLVSMMGEPFVEAQLAIKQASSNRHTFLAHFANGYAGYLPTTRAFAGGGYETRTGPASKFVPEALDQVTAGAIDLLAQLHADA